MELLHKVLFALLSGFSELIFVPVSVHQLIYRTVTGHELSDALLPFAIHAGCLVALLLNYNKRIKRLRYERRLQLSRGRRQTRQPDMSALMDIRILNTAVIPLLFGFLLYPKVSTWISTPLWIAVVLLVNGGILFLPRLLRSGNKKGQDLSPVEGFIIGLSGVLGIIPGFSRVGCVYSASVACGAEKNYSLDLSLLLSIPAISALLCFDLYGCVVSDSGISLLQLLGAVLAAVVSYCGAQMGISFMRSICNRSGTVGFGYYSCAISIFLLLIYLFIP